MYLLATDQQLRKYVGLFGRPDRHFYCYVVLRLEEQTQSTIVQFLLDIINQQQRKIRRRAILDQSDIKPQQHWIRISNFEISRRLQSTPHRPHINRGESRASRREVGRAALEFVVVEDDFDWDQQVAVELQDHELGDDGEFVDDVVLQVLETEQGGLLVRVDQLAVLANPAYFEFGLVDYDCCEF